MAHVFEFTTLDLPRGQGQSWMLAWKPPARQSIRQYSLSVRLAPSGERHPDRRRKSLSPLLLVEDAIPKVVVRRETRPDIPDAVGKNLEGYSWIIVPTWSGNTKGTRACTRSVGATKVLRSR